MTHNPVVNKRRGGPVQVVRRPRVLVGSVLFAGFLVLFGTPSPSAAVSSDWGSGIVAALPANAAATNQYVSITSVSCPSPGNCGAVGSYTDAGGGTDGLLLTETGGKWSTGVEAKLPASAVDAGAGGVVLSSISCASAGNCTAVGQYRVDAGTFQGLLLTETHGTWAAGVEAVLPANARSSYQSVNLTSVSCPSAGNCSAVGSYSDSSPSFQGLLLSETAGTWATGVEVSLPADNHGTGNAFLDSVSCASAGNCTAVGYYDAPSPIYTLSRGLLVSEKAGTWVAGLEAPLPANASTDITSSDVDSVSCSSPGDCTAVGVYSDNSDKVEGLLLTETAGSWATGVEAALPANSAKTGLGSSDVFYGGSLLPLSSVSCSSPGNCTAVGSYPDNSGNTQGLLLTQTAGTWATGAEAALPADAAASPQGVNLASVSCASAGNCAAVGTYGVSTGGGAPLLLTEAGGSWATGVEPSLPANASQATFGVNSVSCASAGNCGGVGSYWVSSGGEFGLLIGGASPLVRLTISTGTGTGTGTVSSAPAGLSCGTGCSHAYVSGTPIILTAAPAPGSVFAGLSGCLATATTTCAVTIDADTTITATFDLAPKPKPKPKSCRVPNLTRETLAAATWSIRTKACTVGAVRRVTSSVLRTPRVISQRPKAGSRLEHGAKVNLVLASATFHCTVPRMIGLSVRAAERRLRLADCRVGGVRFRTSTLLSERHVVEQNPARGRTKPAGARVVLVVGKGPRTRTVPSLGSIVPSRLPPFIAYDPPAGGVWLMKPDGSDAHQVGPSDATGPVWSPNAAQILYTAAAPQSEALVSNDLYVMNADGTDRLSLMRSSWGDGRSGWGYYDFHWSPDGKQIVFTQSCSADAIAIANADGSDAHSVPNTSGAAEASFSPDGRYIVFNGSGGSGGCGHVTGPTHPDLAKSGIYVVKADGTGLRELTFGGGVDDPTWSPDGTRILYRCLGVEDGQPHGICELSGNPARQRILYKNENQTVLDPTWNADGTKILVTLAPSQGSEEIALLSPSGGRPEVIATLPPLYSGTSWNADW